MPAQYEPDNNEPSHQVRDRRKEDYEPFYHANSGHVFDPKIQKSKYWSKSSFHEKTVRRVGTIYKCLINAMYGRSFYLVASTNSNKYLTLLANTYAHAELLGMSEDVLDRIKHEVYHLPNKWGSWAQIGRPIDMIFHFAYEIKAEEVYLDAVMHLVADTYPEPLGKRLDLADPKKFDEDKLALLMAARLQYEELLPTFKIKFWPRLITGNLMETMSEQECLEWSLISSVNS